MMFLDKGSACRSRSLPAALKRSMARRGGLTPREGLLPSPTQFESYGTRLPCPVKLMLSPTGSEEVEMSLRWSVGLLLAHWE